MDEKKWSLSIFEAIGFLVLLIVVYIVISTILGSLLANTVLFESTNGMVIYSIITKSLVVYIVMLIITKNNIGKLNLKFKGKIDKYWVLATIVFSFGLHIIGFEVLNIMCRLVPMSYKWIEIFSNFSDLNPILLVLSAVVTAPITEELLFRGVLANGLSKKYSHTTTIIITALMFGIIHLNIWQFAVAFVTGLFLGWIYLQTESMMLALLVHAMINGIKPLMQLFNVQILGYTIDRAGAFNYHPWWWNAFGIALMIIATLMYRKMLLKKYDANNNLIV